jgi:hypothetical protein
MPKLGPEVDLEELLPEAKKQKIVDTYKPFIEDGAKMKMGRAKPVTLEGDDKLSTVVTNLKKAAKELGKEDVVGIRENKEANIAIIFKMTAKQQETRKKRVAALSKPRKKKE